MSTTTTTATMKYSDSYKRLIESNTETAMKNYRNGKPLFTRVMLKEFEDLLTGKETKLKFSNYIDRESTVKVEKLSDRPEKQMVLINYNCIEALTKPNPFYGDLCLMCPLYVSTSTKAKDKSLTPEEFKHRYASQSKIWEESKTCQSLVEQLRRFTPNQINGVKKIFGFGLGDVDKIERSHKGHVQRPIAQHASLKTIAKFLEERNGGRRVPCYSQDPLLRDGRGAEFIESIGITALDDPKGFIEVDEETFVVSVAPNVPVRQVIADLTKPRAMLWDSVDETNTREWTCCKDENGKTYWECPYTTDPVSPRVTTLIEDYDRFDFVDHNEWFCVTAMYVRKD